MKDYIRQRVLHSLTASRRHLAPLEHLFLASTLHSAESAHCSTFAMPHFFERARHVIVRNGWFVAEKVKVHIFKLGHAIVS